MEPLPGITKTRIPPTPRRLRPVPRHQTLPFVLRLLSRVADGFVVIMVGGIAGLMTPADPVTGGRHPLAVSGGLVVALVAIAWWSSRTGRSPGKVLFGGRLVRNSDPRLPITFGRALGRLAVTLTPLGFWFVLGRSRRTLADRLTDTAVIRDPA